MTDPDVLVVGGGPAGSAAAGLLARLGWHVQVVDKAHFPRPKPCGECLNPGAVAALRRLGVLDRVHSLAPGRLEGWRIRGDDVEAAATFSGGAYALGAPRDLLDTTLLEAAAQRGAEVLQGVQVEGVAAAALLDARPTVTIRDPGGARRIVRPRIVVGADGLRSVVSRSLGLLRRRPRLAKVSLTFRLRHPPPDPGGAPRPSPREGVLDTRDGITLGLAPVSDGEEDGTLVWNASVVAFAARHGRAVARDPVSFFRRVLAERLPAVAGWEIAAGPWASGPFDWPTRRCWASGVVLVGDAAGYYDPFTGQGIYRALRSAELAAAAVGAELAAPTPSWGALRAYGHAWRRETLLPVWVQRRVEDVMAHGALCRAVLGRLAATGGLGQVIRVTGDVASPATLLDPRLWLRAGTRLPTA
jgi:2-polyprenyl-6-methoxyphenol hydroxylase-like FAD-dependent oxidoreductase